VRSEDEEEKFDCAPPLMEYPREEIVDMLSEQEMRNVGETPPNAEPFESVVEFFPAWRETEGAVLSK